MELDVSQMALELSHHSYLLVTHLTTQEHCCHTSFHVHWYMNVMWSSRLFRVSLFLENASILMIWGCFSIVSNVIRSNYCCRRHTMHGNMVFSRDSIFPTPQQSGCLCVCSVYIFHFLSFVSALRLKKYFIAKLNCLNMSYHCNCQILILSITKNYIFEHFIKHVRYLIMNFVFGRYFMWIQYFMYIV